jgi:hypothetical protein
LPFGAGVLAKARPHSYGRCEDVFSSKHAGPLPGASCTFKLEIEILGIKKTFEATLKDVNFTEAGARYEGKFVRPGKELPAGLTLQVRLEESTPLVAAAVGVRDIHLAIAKGEG